MSVLGNRIVWGNPQERDLAPLFFLSFFSKYIYTQQCPSFHFLCSSRPFFLPQQLPWGFLSDWRALATRSLSVGPCSGGKW